MIRGEVYEYTIGSHLARIVIVSARAYNPRRATFAVVLGPSVPTPPVAVAVAATDDDPVRGTIDASRLRPLDPTAVGARIGRLSVPTLRNLDQALRTYLDML